MAIRNANFGGTNLADGEVLYDYDVDDTIDAIYNNLSKIFEIDTSTDLDSSINSATTASDENSHEFSSISSDVLGVKNYLIIKCTCTVSGSVVVSTGQGSAGAQLKIQTKEIGGSYSDSLAYTNILAISPSQSNNGWNSSTITFEHIHTLSAGEKSNGVQVKVFAKAFATSIYASITSMTGTFTNIQTSIMVI